MRVLHSYSYDFSAEVPNNFTDAYNKIKTTYVNALNLYKKEPSKKIYMSPVSASVFGGRFTGPKYGGDLGSGGHVLPHVHVIALADAIQETKLRDDKNIYLWYFQGADMKIANDIVKYLNPEKSIGGGDRGRWFE